jgi:hypothetical protein
VTPFTPEEVARIVQDSPSDRAPGPDGFSGAFYYKVAWEVVGPDIFKVFEAFWHLDFRSLNLLNEAVMVLLHKTDAPQGLTAHQLDTFHWKVDSQGSSNAPRAVHGYDCQAKSVGFHQRASDP